MSCKPTYKGKRYNSLEELYRANGVNEQQKQQAQQLYSQYLEQTGKQDIEGFKEFVQGKQFQKLTEEEKTKAIEQLFEENLELANAVYQALGFTGAISLESNLKNTGKTEQDLINYLKKKYPEIKLSITNNPVWEQGDNVFNQEEYNNQVNYRLKATEILLSDKAKQVFKNGEKNGWDLNKILTELQIPKEQKQLILNLGITDREQIALELASNYSYTVEINTAKEIQKMGDIIPNQFDNGFEIDGDTYERIIDVEEDFSAKYYKNNKEIEYVEYEQALNLKRKRYSETKEFPTQHYSNLTVPGGTNYTENAIRTPGVVNVISADGGYHDGDFNQSRGDMAGWFRSDEQKSDYLEAEPWMPIEIVGPKTRRILELQSFFQKVRDKDNLINGKEVQDNYNAQYNDNIETFYDADNNRYFKIEDGKETTITEKEFNSINVPKESSKNQFLQLLNKDSNWVTFFIKSIIQDSAKKGYEKVLFPKGETAAKIEGHETIAEEIRKINTKLQELKDSKLWQVGYKFGGNIKAFKTEEEAIAFSMTMNDVSVYKPKINVQEQINKLEQQKAELKSQGIEKLKPIEAFYEIKVGNILEKQFGKDNVKTITDEYGNQWREITINQARDLSNILLQKDDANRIIGQANIKAMTVLVDAVNKKADTIPHEYAHHYIAWFRDTPIVQEGIKRFGSEEALVQAIGEQVVKQKGEAYNWWKRFTNFILNLLSDKQLLQVLTDSFLNRTDLNSDFTYNQITPQQKQQAQIIYSQYLNTIFPDSKVKDIVYHGSGEKRDVLDPSKQVRGRFGQGISFASTPQLVEQLIDNAVIHAAVINLVNPLTEVPQFKDDVDVAVKEGNHDGVQVGNLEYTVPTKEQIHILGSKQDIEGFRAFVESNNIKTNNSELIDKNIESKIKPVVNAENKTIKNNYETFKEVQDFFDSNLSTMDNIYNAIFNNSEITPDDIIKQIIKTDNVEKECNGGVSDSSWEIV